MTSVGPAFDDKTGYAGGDGAQPSSGGRAGLRRPRALRGARGWLVLALLLGAWQLIGNPKSPEFPPPSVWVHSGASLLARATVLAEIGRTALLFVAGLALVVVVGTAIGMLVGSSVRADRALGPLLNVFRVTPAPVLVPFATLVLGYSFTMSVVVVVFGTIWPVLLEVRAGRRAMGSTLVDVASSLGLPRRATMRKVLVPALVGSVLNGTTVAAPLCLIVAIVVGMIAALPSLGGLILSAQANFDSGEVYALVVVAGLLAYVVNVVVRAAEVSYRRRTGT